jgi:UDP-N-acetylglucosamine:LPS N-acetylglucosamine transferase
MRPLHVVVIYTDAGGGHRATGEALKDILEGSGRYRVTMVNAYQEVLPHLDLFARYTSRDVEQTYNQLVLREGRTGLFCLAFYLGALINVMTLGRRARTAFTDLWDRIEPDLVVSVLPMINHILADSLKGYSDASVPFTVLMTDWAEIAPTVWFPKRKDYFAITGTDVSQDQVSRKPHPEDKLFRLDGLLTRAIFLEPPPSDRAAARADLGLAPDKPVVCMMYGGYGSVRMLELAEALRHDPPDIQMVFLCGRNEALAQSIEAAALPFPTLVKGYTRDVHRFMAVSDVFIGKTGPLSVSEALAFGLPILIDQESVLPQEHAVLNWITRTGAGAAFSKPAGFVLSLKALLAKGTAARNPGVGMPRGNRAAKQIPGIIDEIARRSGLMP